MASVYQRKFTEEEMRRAFQCFDTDSSGNSSFPLLTNSRSHFISGYITAHELQEVLKRLNHPLSEQVVREVIRNIDLDQDGKISFEEFVRIVQES